MLGSISYAVIATYVADKILGDIITTGFRSYIVNIFKKSNKTRKKHLIAAIRKTCEDFENRYGEGTRSDGKFPFYQSQVIVEQLLKYRLFGKFDHDRLRQVLSENPKIIQPTEKQTMEFFQLFEGHVKSDQHLAFLEVEDTYKNQVFEIHSTLQSMNLGIRNEISSTIRQLENSLQQEYQEELNQFRKDILDFKPITALAHLEALEARSEGSITKSQVLSKIFHLKAICYRELKDIEQKAKSYIKAFTYEPNNLEYKSLAAIGYCNLEMIEKGVDLAREVLEEDEFNAKAWMVIFEYANNAQASALNSIPQIVRGNTNFKILLSGLVFKTKAVELIPFLSELFEEELQSKKVPTEINYDNKDYWGAILNLRYNKFFQEYNFIYTFKLEEEVSANADLKIIFQILKKYYEKIYPSELVVSYADVIFSYKQVNYLIERSKECALELYNYYQQLKGELDGLALPVVFALTQTSQYDKALKIIDEAGNFEDPAIYAIGQQISMRINNDELISKYADRFFNSITKIDHSNLDHVLIHLNLNYPSHEEKEIFVNGLRERKILIGTIDEKILQAFILTQSDEKHNDVLRLIDEILSEVGENDLVRRRMIANFYSIIDEFDKANKILVPFVNFDKPSSELTFFIENLYFSKKDIQELLFILEKYRQHTIDERFLRWELQAAQNIPDWERIEVISKIGNNHFPENANFLTFKIIALHKLSKADELEQSLNSILKTTFHFDHASRIASICIINKQYDLALKLIYNFAKEPNNTQAREFYALSVGLHIPKDHFKVLSVVEVDTVVHVQIGGEFHQYVIDQAGLEQNNIIRELLGRRINDDFEVEQRVLNQTLKVTILKILSKEEALFLEIYEDVNRKAGIDYNVVNVQPKGDAEDILDKMGELFGAKEEFRAKQVQEYINDYKENKLNFSQLVKAVFNGKALDAYHELTSFGIRCFRVMPLAFQKAPLHENTAFVLDLSVLPLFHELDTKFGIRFNRDFVISQFVLEFLEEAFFEANHMDDRPLSIVFQKGKAIPQMYPENHKSNRINYLSDLINWIKENCRTKLVREKLDLIVQYREEDKEMDPYFHYLIDTAFLASQQNQILISDDSIFSVLGTNHNYNQISAERYLGEFHKDQYIDKIIPVLLDKNYLGLTIDQNILLSEYYRNLQKLKGFYKCLINLPLNISYNAQTVPECIAFIKELYLHPIPDNEKHRLTVSVFQNALTGITLDKGKVQMIEIMIEKSFQLLGYYKDYVLQDFADALKTLKRT